MAQSILCMTIRPMVIGDYEQVYRLWVNTPGMGLNTVDDSYKGIAKYLQRNPATSFVAVDEGDVVGAILCGHDGRRGVIHHTAVKETVRRCGVGKALVKAAMDALRKEEITKAWLVVFKRNELGNAFWEQLGFEERDDLSFRGITLDYNLVRIDT